MTRLFLSVSVVVAFISFNSTILLHAAENASVVGSVPVAATTAEQTHSKTEVPVSVLDRFRTFTGTPTPAILRDLFNKPYASNIRQQPVVVLSDGASTVSVSLSLNLPNNKSPNIALNGAQLVAIRQIKPNEWEVEALPDTGTSKVTMFVITDSQTIEIPVTVAPSLPSEIDVSDIGFSAFLSGDGGSVVPSLDLNDDGRRDYMDIFIFTANSIARSDRTSSGLETGQSQVISPAPDVQVEIKAKIDNTDKTPRSENTGTSVSGATGTGSTSQGSSGTPSAYQKNLAIRNQLLQESRKRRSTPVPTPTVDPVSP